MKAVLALIGSLLVLAVAACVSWIATAFVVYTLSYFFGWTYTWATITGTWILAMVIQYTIKSIGKIKAK